MALQSKGKLVTKAMQTLLSFWSSQLYVDENLLLERGLHQLISSLVILFQNKHGLVVVLKNDQSGRKNVPNTPPFSFVCFIKLNCFFIRLDIIYFKWLYKFISSLVTIGALPSLVSGSRVKCVKILLPLRHYLFSNINR